MVRYYEKQQYAKLLKTHKRRCKRGKPFTDPTFPASDASLYLRPGRKQERDVVWKRPTEIVDNPKLVVGKVSGKDLIQGEVGNCWFVAACSRLADVPALWHKVVVDKDDQEWSERHPNKHVGIFRFRFWRMGDWVEVVIDDRLPTVNGRLIYCKSAHGFWAALLEKAYAKLAGSYEALEGGDVGDAFVDFSGGVSKRLKLNEYRDCEKDQKELFKIMRKEMGLEAMLGCLSYDPGSSGETATCLDTGLYKNHAYIISAVKKVKVRDGFFSGRKFKLVRIRNPWGAGEWRGAWSDGSDEWQKVSLSERTRLGITFEEDGEFWMSFSDWLTHYTHATITRPVKQKGWHESSVVGEWCGRTAGGFLGYDKAFFQNPQYMFRIANRQHGGVIVDLMQEDHRHQSKDRDDLCIGFRIFQVEENREHRLHRRIMAETVGEVKFMHSRSVYSEFDLPQGNFVIIPSTFDPGKERKFLLRVYTRNPNSACLRELTMPHLCLPLWQRCTENYKAIVSLSIRSVSGLANQSKSSSCFPCCPSASQYCKVICDRQTAQIPILASNGDEIQCIKLVFFMKRTRQPVKVEIWNRNAIQDRFVGQALVKVAPYEKKREYTYDLHKRGKPKKRTRGVLSLTVFGTKDTTSL